MGWMAGWGKVQFMVPGTLFPMLDLFAFTYLSSFLSPLLCLLLFFLSSSFFFIFSSPLNSVGIIHWGIQHHPRHAIDTSFMNNPAPAQNHKITYNHRQLSGLPTPDIHRPQAPLDRSSQAVRYPRRRALFGSQSTACLTPRLASKRMSTSPRIPPNITMTIQSPRGAKIRAFCPWWLMRETMKKM